MPDSSSNTKNKKNSDLSSCSFSLMSNYQSLQIIEKTPYLWIFAMLRKSPMSCVRIFQTCGDPHSFLDIQVAGRSRISFGKFSWEKEGSIGVLSGGNKLCDISSSQNIAVHDFMKKEQSFIRLHFLFDTRAFNFLLT